MKRPTAIVRTATGGYGAGRYVRGIQGLRIADASVMPTIPSANTQAPTVTIGEFASRLLLPGRVAVAA